MNYENMPNLLLEALSYLGRKASGNTWDHMEQKIKQKNLQNIDSFENTFSKIKKLTYAMDKSISINNNILHSLFSNFDGFSFNTIGSSSIAFLLFYNVLENFNGDFKKLIKDMKNFSPERIAYNIAEALDISDNCQIKESITSQQFIDRIISLDIPAESKISILNTYSNYEKYLIEASSCLGTVITFLEQNMEMINDITYSFNKEISQCGPKKIFSEISQLEISDKIHYNMRPFIFGMDTTLTSTNNENTIFIYCGILRKELLHMLNCETTNIDQVYKAYNLLGDRTRFDILCYLRKKRAYGQELSNHFKLSRNTIHHHMNKLINYGLVTCTNDGNRVYYSLNTETFEKLIASQKEIFLS